MDVETGEISALLPLGTKSFEEYAIDPSSVDGGVSMDKYPVSGLY